jgi:hypothetical protein
MTTSGRGRLGIDTIVALAKRAAKACAERIGAHARLPVG